jgi:hypothetical protein
VAAHDEPAVASELVDEGCANCPVLLRVLVEVEAPPRLVEQRRMRRDVAESRRLGSFGRDP